ncbi:MAG: 2-aminoethylphosphonate--pyruvate transaminase [Rhodospirillales bacterium]|nr:2-aminoethylphosphonate--pyruvate transaminase [Rhodospirillales bacterium]
MESTVPPAKDKPLFTPGPLTTSITVKQAMQRDLGPRDHAFKRIIVEVRERLLKLAGVSRDEGFEAILLQGCGTMGVEGVISCVVPRGGKALVITNGAYGKRILKMTNALAEMTPVELAYEEHQPVDPADVDRVLSKQPDIDFVAIVHCETTSGMMNPIDEVGRVVKQHGKTYFVDAMSSFGAVPVDIQGWGIDHMVSSANKAIEGVPGFSFAICRRADLEANEGASRTLSLDLLAQLRGFEHDGQFLYTPPTHSILAFRQALDELDMEGGIEARGRRYARNHEVLVAGMREMGFETYLPDELQGPIITTFHAPNVPGFDFNTFYDSVENKGYVIYGGKVLHTKSFRIAHVGRIFESDTRALLGAIAQTLEEMGIRDTLADRAVIA